MRAAHACLIWTRLHDRSVHASYGLRSSLYKDLLIQTMDIVVSLVFTNASATGCWMVAGGNTVYEDWRKSIVIEEHETKSVQI